MTMPNTGTGVDGVKCSTFNVSPKEKLLKATNFKRTRYPTAHSGAILSKSIRKRLDVLKNGARPG